MLVMHRAIDCPSSFALPFPPLPAAVSSPTAATWSTSAAATSSADAGGWSVVSAGSPHTPASTATVGALPTSELSRFSAIGTVEVQSMGGGAVTVVVGRPLAKRGGGGEHDVLSVIGRDRHRGMSRAKRLARLRPLPPPSHAPLPPPLPPSLPLGSDPTATDTATPSASLPGPPGTQASAMPGTAAQPTSESGAAGPPWASPGGSAATVAAITTLTITPGTQVGDTTVDVASAPASLLQPTTVLTGAVHPPSPAPLAQTALSSPSPPVRPAEIQTARAISPLLVAAPVTPEQTMHISAATAADSAIPSLAGAFRSASQQEQSQPLVPQSSHSLQFPQPAQPVTARPAVAAAVPSVPPATAQPSPAPLPTSTTSAAAAVAAAVVATSAMGQSPPPPAQVASAQATRRPSAIAGLPGSYGVASPPSSQTLGNTMPEYRSEEDGHQQTRR